MNIVAIINCQGFQHGIPYRVRELAWIKNADNAVVQNFQVDPGFLPSFGAAQKTFAFTKYHVHGLSFRPPQYVARVHHHDVIRILRNLYNEAGGQGSVAYKGGFIERDLLQRAGIPSTNLETMGVPCFHKSASDNSYSSCGNHKFYEFGEYNCASSKVMFYKDVIRNVWC